MPLYLNRWFMLALVLLLGGCHATPQSALLLRYQFQDGGQYRVDDAYQIEKQTTKSHEGKVFSSDAQAQFVQASFRVKTRMTEDQVLIVEYRLLRLRVHDDAGHFKLEIGPENGQLSWYNQDQPLAGYLDSREFARYQQLMRKPVVVLKVNTRGVEQPGGMRFDNDLLALLGKNRVIGQQIVKAFKVPPLVTVVFSEAAVHPGDTWDYQGNSQEPNGNKPLTTRFRLKQVKDQNAEITLSNRVDFTGEELKALGSQLGLPETTRMVFKESFLRVDGSVFFLPAHQRPASGVLNVEKHYGLQVDQETWDLSEKEKHAYTVTLDL
jgi:hypothetical protein